ncbi:MAG: alanine--tRNA ligase, partial [Alphaproteobacteria bacterium]|nr:alanine--tRNA ligase [Alphaproteobacteria bacterium]
MQSAADIRREFLGFFADRGHEVVPSSPLIPHNDPTLLFTNAGMVQFKNVFSGSETRPYSRAASSQKCVRAGGKHNDLENVGFTSRHHTFFEMLGNFSFGDYFKEEAIEAAWTLLTKDFGVNADRLLVTVYIDDDPAFELWKKIAGLSDDRILRIDGSDNFWSMGETGPCGPCSEIFFDHGEDIPGGPPGSPDQDGDRFVEIWNLVFTQYEQISADERVDLKKPGIDTGMGLERITAVLQGVHDNYDIDLFKGLIGASAEVSGQAPRGEHANSHRVIADHLRSTCFLMADGVMPSNEGRGYVLRRIMRRAMRHAHIMGTKDPLMHRLVPALVDSMGTAFPELVRAQALMTETLKLEEIRFRETLARGLSFLDDAVARSDGKGDLSGEEAFKLYDTYGFPLDLTQDALRSKGMGVDTAGFGAAMERQRKAARAAWAGSGEEAEERVWFEMREEISATEFLGYETEGAEGRIDAIVADGATVASAAEGTDVAIIANQTPFYGQSGGQEGDAGIIAVAGGAEISVRDTKKKLGDLHVHFGTVTRGEVRTGDLAEMRVDHAARTKLRANHSATHLLHAAMRTELGDHVTQKGSLVAADRLRFDISHPKPVTSDELARIESAVNAQIRGNSEVRTLIMSPDEAVEQGAMALFGEKYGDEVRVVSMGSGSNTDDVYSTELCGGTHVGRTGDIGAFKIIAEAAVAAGVRRIEALTGEGASQHAWDQENLVRSAAAALKSAPGDLVDRVGALMDERKRLDRELADARKQLAMGGSGGGSSGGDTPVKEIAGVRFDGRVVDGVSPKDLKGMVDELKQSGPGIYALVAAIDGKASL